ncbi:BCCT family transporter [Salisediminibacterium beveridgei]|uniref:Glycine betaine transporter OpuD n=1 Tax=Salisediminibacterium beveridgei TaxID=632773 RepID=A0A1D7QST1_9BACI|nr:BCCT family transporter [Salisediminibacterium beveridgei]AOM82080.1 Glycine betaine transporter OpuD [Salisediminibacterium beveridgei]
MNIKSKIDWPVLAISGGVLVLFVIASILSSGWTNNAVNLSFDFAANYFGLFWQVLMLATFVVAIGIAVSKYGKVQLGNLAKPEMSYFKWLSIIMCTLLAGGGVFWAAAEPMYHFMTTPPMNTGVEAGTESAVIPALSQSFMHWGFLAWAILGTLGAIVMMYAHYHKGMPMKPRSLLYPVFGEKIMKDSPLGTMADAFSIVAVAAGTIGPIGFLGLQAAYGFDALFGIPNTFATQALIIIGLITIASISAVTGVHRGIQFLSRFNVIFTFVLIVAVMLLGPGAFIMNNFVGAYGTYLSDFTSTSLYRGDAGWLSFWTVFFWGWFIGYGPMMAIFISRISRGRTIRELVTAVAIIAPLVTNFWFSVVGGSGIFFELQNPGSVSEALNTGGMPASMIAIVTQLPFGTLMAFAFLFVTIIFVATTSDSMSYTISMAITGSSSPTSMIRVFWAVVMGTTAISLLYIGEGSIDALQSFIVVTAVPVSLILLPLIWTAPRVARQMAQDQEHASKEETTESNQEKQVS